MWEYGVRVKEVNKKKERRQGREVRYSAAAAAAAAAGTLKHLMTEYSNLGL